VALAFQTFLGAVIVSTAAPLNKKGYIREPDYELMKASTPASRFVDAYDALRRSGAASRSNPQPEDLLRNLVAALNATNPSTDEK
jgi:hypothetical protein